MSGATSCKPCRENSFAIETHRQDPCDQCAQGRTSKEGSTKCSDCSPGKFKNIVNDEEICTECPIGFAQSETDQTNCTQCQKGEEAPTVGSSFCLACDLGAFNSIGGKNCLACPAGQYQDGKGESFCKECDVDTYLNEQGKSSKADCHACSNERSTGTVQGATQASACLCQRALFYHDAIEDTCIACPTGADCARTDGIVLNELVAVNGYW